ncbi:hypothetical protein XENOCAPTIV_010617 [Xenoophorus captivus]|uniref:Uncharacterized protein n=1 Tax=Xenoophorus captivus TaxID=1517983 RepID=A0ABV0QA65_9TELE
MVHAGHACFFYSSICSPTSFNRNLPKRFDRQVEEENMAWRDEMNLQALAVSEPDLDSYPPWRRVLGAVGGAPIIDRPKEQSDTRPVPSADDCCKEDPSFRGSSPEPVSSTSSHHRLKSHHTRGADRRTHRKDDEGELLTIPMVEVAGPNGSMLVHRPWSPADVQAAASHLPNPKEGGKKFADDLHSLSKTMYPTGRELRQILSSKLKTGELVGLIGLPQPDLRAKHPHWDHADNQDYRNATDRLCASLR